MNKLGCVLELMVGALWVTGGPEGKEEDRDQAEDLVELGFSFYQNRKIKDAIGYFKQALKVSERADIYNSIGFVYLNEKEYGKAVNAFKKSLSVDPGYIPAFYNLGVTMYYAKVYDSAVGIFEKITAAPEIDKKMIVNAHNEKGCAYDRKGLEQEAIKSFETAIVLDDTFERPYVNIANTYCKQGELDKAKAKYNKALKLNENCASALNGLGVVCVEEENYQEAEKYFEKALEKDSYCQSAYINKMILKKHGKISS